MRSANHFRRFFGGCVRRFRALGCEIFQGYYFSRPLVGEDCLQFILDREEGGVFPAALRLVSVVKPSRTAE